MLITNRSRSYAKDIAETFSCFRLLCTSIFFMVHNFNAGPSILPREVLQQASESLLNFNNSGLSILEIGHRTALFEEVLHEAVLLVKELMELDADHEVLFLHGGASTQFMQVPYNLLDESMTAAYIDNGIWGSKAIKEARLFGNVDVVASSKDKNHTYLPKEFTTPANVAYLHLHYCLHLQKCYYYRFLDLPSILYLRPTIVMPCTTNKTAKY